MSRERAIEIAAGYADDGTFLADLAGRVAVPTESRNPERVGALAEYLHLLSGTFRDRLGCELAVFDNPDPVGGPLLVASRWEAEALPTVLAYGHGDVVDGMSGRWSAGRDPWKVVVEGERIYGRGTADNKGQHTILMLALEAVLRVRGRLGFNLVFLIDTCEEVGSFGLQEFCAKEKDRLSGDLFIAADGPRLKPDLPTLFGGTRAACEFDLICNLREGGHHSGNWGGLLANPGILLAHAIASLVSATGRIEARELTPGALTVATRGALAGVRIDPGESGPALDPWWGEPGLTPPERVFAWQALEVLAFETGNPGQPVNAIPPRAWARLQLRHTPAVRQEDILPAIRRHLAAHGLERVDVRPTRTDAPWRATWLDPDHPAARWAVRSVERTTGRAPVFLPSVGGTAPNACFAETLGMPTIWMPHSYGGCSQHAPDEHLLKPLVREGLAMSAGLFWDVAEDDTFRATG